MELSVNQLGLQVNHGEARLDAIHHLGLRSLEDAGDVLLGDSAAPDVIDKLETLPRVWLQDHVYLGKLARATALLLVGIPELIWRGDGLAVCNLRCTNLGIYLEFPLQPINDDLQVQLPHTLNDRLVGFLIPAETEGWVFTRKLCQSINHLVRVYLGLWLASNLDHRLWELHSLQRDRGIEGAKSVAGSGVLEAEKGNNVTSIGLLDLFARVRVHQDHAPKAFLLLCTGVEHHLPCLDASRVDAEEGDGTNVRICGHLESQSSKLLIWSVLA
mmetsp:Transcript_97521/g.284733  ORF Transcript_97521/g.284733 Transcript_97521/m.284733 type:complete len:272 (-) Transcript_97521:866-1681(-)